MDFCEGKEHDILLDTGLSCGCMLHNAGQLGINPAKAEAIVLSHGHFDHTGGLSSVLQTAGHQLPVVAHPDTFLSRRLQSKGKDPVNLPKLRCNRHKTAWRGYYRASRPVSSSLWPPAGHRRDRTTVPFEKGFPGMEAYVGDKWVPDGSLMTRLLLSI